MQACHWKAHNTFTKFYLKDLTWSDNDNNVYLGPAVATQQVLDPSPQTSYSRKEKKGGGSSATTESSGVYIPGSRYKVPHQDVWVRYFFLFQCIFYYV